MNARSHTPSGIFRKKVFMEIFKNYIALRELLPDAPKADFSSLPREMDTPFTSMSSAVFSEEKKLVDRIFRIDLPAPIIPRYAHLDSGALACYLDMKSIDLSWILRSRYCVNIVEGKWEIHTVNEFDSAAGEDGRPNYYTGAVGLEMAFDTVDPFDEAFRLEMRAFDPFLPGGDYDSVRRRAAVVAAVARGELRKEDFFLRSIPILPLVADLAKGDPKEFLTSKLAQLSYRLFQRARRLENMMANTKAPYIVIINEERMLQQAADRLFAEYQLAGIKFEK